MRRSFGTMLLASTAICLLAGAPARAQTAEAGPAAEAADANEPQPDGETAGDIVVVGTRIEGARVTEALPVVVVNQDKLDAIGAVSGDELIRNIPQMGDVSFNPGNNAQTSNAARGDVGSVIGRRQHAGAAQWPPDRHPPRQPGPVGHGHRPGTEL